MEKGCWCERRISKYESDEEIPHGFCILYWKERVNDFHQLHCTSTEMT